jgi:hypothetical protein
MVTGDLGSMIEHEFAASVVRVIIAGNSLYPAAKLPEGVTIKSINTVISPILTFFLSPRHLPPNNKKKCQHLLESLTPS